MNEYKGRMDRGFKMLKQLDREGAMMIQKDIYPELYDLSVGHLFGDIWTRKPLSLREREMVTLATLINVGYAAGIQSHCRSAMHLGITKEEIMELFIQVGAYAGWPRMAAATREFAKVLEEDGAKKKKGKKKNERKRKSAA